MSEYLCARERLDVYVGMLDVYVGSLTRVYVPACILAERTRIFALVCVCFVCARVV